MSAHVIGIVRGRTRLEALTYEARDPGDKTAPWRIDHACELRPLAPGVRPELWRAWYALVAVADWTEDVRAAVQLVLRETVPAGDDAGELPALGDDVHPVAPPRATAAHPRAYRGTRHKPPRPSQPAPVDVRAYLQARRHVDQVLAQLGAPPEPDPTAGFDPAFVRQLWPLVRAGDPGAFAALARAFDLAHAPALRGALVAVYRAAAEPARALGWWSHVLAFPTEQRLEAAQLVAASGVATIDAEHASDIASLAAPDRWSIYRALARGASPAYVMSGLALGALSGKIADLPAGREDVTAIVSSTAVRLAEAMEEDGGAAFWTGFLWQRCGAQPGLAELLARPDLAALAPAAAFWVVRWACSPGWFSPTPQEDWAALAPVLPVVLERAAAVEPAYQRKFVEDLSECSEPRATEAAIRAALAAIVDLCARVARPPFTTDSVLRPLTAWLANDPEAAMPGVAAMVRAPDASWLALEAASHRGNDARLVGRGLAHLARSAPDLLATFATAVKPLLRTVDSLMLLSPEAAERALARYRASAIAAPGVDQLPLEALVALVDPIARAGGPNPVRKALRRHLAGTSLLGEAQIAGHRARIVAALDELRLAALRQIIEADRAAHLGVERIENATVRHALGILRFADRQRRQLRRLLTARLAGDAAWVERHPETLAWFARHPGLDREVWLAGVEIVREVDGLGRVRLAVERDPLEALKLGTYVGSCLGRGGLLEYSAAATVLDINKRVIYARDANGSVIGRQVVALSEDEELVCFSVYGAAWESLEPLFRELDQDFARALDRPIYAGGRRDPYIAYVLAHEWWDDSAWL